MASSHPPPSSAHPAGPGRTIRTVLRSTRKGVEHAGDSLLEWGLSPLSRPVLLIQGFWRSGTTWLLQEAAHAARARAVFEPLSPSSGTRFPFQPEGGEGVPAPHFYLPLTFGDLGPDAERALSEAFRGRVRTPFARRGRSSRLEYLRRRVVVKSVRLGFVLEPLLGNRAIPCLHVRRHPGAVLASLGRVRWFNSRGWSISEDAPLSRVYEREPDSRVKDTLLAHDQDLFSRFAALWALSEAAVEEAAAHVALEIVQYEELIQTPSRIGDVLARLGIESPRRPLLRDSPVTRPERRGATVEQRRSSWSGELDPGTIDRVRGITETLFPACRALWDSEDQGDT